MSKKKYEKPEIKDFVPSFLHGQMSPMGFCENGLGAGGAGACINGFNVYEDDPDCDFGRRPFGFCDAGEGVSRCHVGTFA